MKAGICAVLVAAALMCGARAKCLGEPKTPAEPKPTVRIPVGPLGYLSPNEFYLTYRLSSASLDFIDDDRLLFTFRLGGLLKRLPSDQDGDDDQEIEAVVLDAHTGKVLKETQWRMHDRQRYLWALTGGRFLVRVRDRLYLTDASLALHPYLQFDSRLRVVEIAPGRQLMALERDTPRKAGLLPGGQENRKQPPPVTVDILKPGTREDLVTSGAQTDVMVPLTSQGILEVLPAKEKADWAVSLMPFAGEPRILAEMKSDCQPDVQPLSDTAALISDCYSTADSRTVVAVSMKDGSKLWQDEWENKYVWGWFTYAENGSRFAYETLEVNQPVGVMDALDASDVKAQMVGVYDTQTGKLVLVRDASPVLSAGQNAALSPDGRRFAVLRDGAVEVYDLPPVG